MTERNDIPRGDGFRINNPRHEPAIRSVDTEMAKLWLGIDGEKLSMREIGDIYGYSYPWVSRRIKRVLVTIVSQYIEGNQPKTSDS